jgi:ferredoxin-type protein NapH
MTEKKKPVRHLAPPATLKETVHRMRFTLARRAVQLLVLLGFAGTARWGWKVFGEPFMDGTLSSSKFAGLVPLSDPLAMLERLFAGHLPTATALLGAVIVLAIYGILGSRTFCGWVCPMNMVTDFADWLRRKLGLEADMVRVTNLVRYGMLAAALALSLATGTAAFETVSPQAWLWRDIIFGSGLAAVSVACAIFAFDLAVMKHGWCGHICPLGAFWALVGRLTRSPGIRIRFDDEACTRCGDCIRVCPEPQVIHFTDLKKTGRIPAGECINCGRCIAHCPENALKFKLFSKKE